MAPACLATIFEGDNGGATSRGVSATEIRVGVAVPTSFASSTPKRRDAITALFEYFNRHYELYGRRLVPVLVEGQTGDPVTSRSFGAAIASNEAFAALTGYLEYAESNVYRPPNMGLVQELARNQVVTITRNGGLGWPDRVLFDANHPYVWSVYPSSETNVTALADFTCTALVGHNATHARDAGLRDKPRRIGVLALGRLSAPSVSDAVDRLTTCDRAPLVVNNATISDTDGSGLRTGLTKLKAEGATTVICACESVYTFTPAVNTARTMGFEPEWVTVASPMRSDELMAGLESYRAAYIRLDSGPRLIPIQARPWFTALLETNPTLMDSAASDAFTGAQLIYDGLLMLAAGIQAAGPNLTADTFASGLLTTQFPNPGAGQAPYWQPSVGLGPGDHAFYDDFSVSWWSETTPAVDPVAATPVGSWCYLGAGSRYRIAGFPSDADSRLYSQSEPCR